MFKKYGHIENMYVEKFIDYLKSMGMMTVPCVCTVKVDGANFQAAVDENDQVTFGKRTAELSDVEQFNRWQNVMEKLDVKNKLFQIRNELGAKNLIIYGELCGGLYRHPDVPIVRDSVRIQGRIDYSPDNEWIVFDILYDEKYLNQLKLQEICKTYNLPCVPIKFQGTLEECINASCEFVDTTGHDLWGYPIIENNVAEGVVIKSIEDVRLPNGERLIIKNKNPKYKERIKETKKNAKPGLNNLETEWEAVFEEYLTESRAWSAVSKIGTVKDFGSLMKAVMADAEEDWRSDYEDELTELERSTDPKDFSFDKIRKMATKKAVIVVRPVWLQIMPKTEEDAK